MIRALTLLAAALALVAGSPASACAGPAAICAEARAGALALIDDGRPLPLLVDGDVEPGVRRAATDLAADLGRVSGGAAAMAEGGAAIIVGTLGRSPIVDRLVREGRIDAKEVSGHWEAYLHQVVERPAPGLERALVIAGADKRGTIFGLYHLSERVGVSPWHYWADVPPARHRRLFVLPGALREAPKVRYRGIFLNDEEPALGNWARQTHGGFNPKFYDRMFDLILRLRGNYLWPAMWGKAFADDDPENARLADERGVVIGTSHHEPMMRAHVEWERHGEGPWDYARNAERLRAFWRGGVVRMGDDESLVTVGMRGDGDEPMAEGTAIGLLETIVADQRKIIAEVTGRPAAETPQVWALYKEVQDYYDKGMRVPDDVTLLFADDNWGNIRRLPGPGAERPGGYGVYYHFDYVGGPRNYKWINTNQIERSWEQMRIAAAHGADRLWIVNVGDLKPMEFPTDFFLDLAWNPDAMSLDRLAGYPREWAARQFGPRHAGAIGELLTRASQYNARRKPELIDPDTYSLTAYDEAERVLAGWRSLVARAEALEREIPAEQRDAFFQLVLHPIIAPANLQELYVAVARNRLYAQQGRATTEAMAERARALYARHQAIRRRYEQEVAGGKWAQMMSQAVIGYTTWQQPDAETMPALRSLAVPEAASMGVAAGSLIFDAIADRTAIVEIYNRGKGALSFSAEAPTWVRLSRSAGEVPGQTSIAVAIDWPKAPAGSARAPLLLRGSDGSETRLDVETRRTADRPGVAFVESDGIVAIEAAHHESAVARGGIGWRTIPNLGKTLSGVTAFPVTAPAQRPGQGPYLDYAVELASAGEVNLQVVLSPTLDYLGQGGLRYAVSIGDEPPQVVNVHAGTGEREWEQAVANAAWLRTTRHRVAVPGRHRIRLWMIDPGLVFQRLILSRGPLPASVLGPPESPRR